MRYLWITSAFLILISVSAFAAAGDACSISGSVQRYAGEKLICNGSIWQLAEKIEINGRAHIQIANDSGSCNAEKTGRLRYNEGTDTWEYCSGSNWSPFESAALAGGLEDCPDIGDQCDDDTIYAGYHPTLHIRFFLHPNNQNASSQWSSAYSNDTGAVDGADGKNNQDWIVANRTIANYPAFKECNDLNLATELGYSDWYLPSRMEMLYLYLIRSDINSGPSDDFLISDYWVSTQFNDDEAWNHDFSDGAQSGDDKVGDLNAVRCIRRN